MKKNDLKTGYLVTLRNGSAYTVLLGVETEDFSGDCIMDAKMKSWFKLDCYNEDLQHCGADGISWRPWDIVKVERQHHPYRIQNPNYEFFAAVDNENEILWEEGKEQEVER